MFAARQESFPSADRLQDILPKRKFSIFITIHLADFRYGVNLYIKI